MKKKESNAKNNFWKKRKAHLLHSAISLCRWDNWLLLLLLLFVICFFFQDTKKVKSVVLAVTETFLIMLPCRSSFNRPVQGNTELYYKASSWSWSNPLKVLLNNLNQTKWIVYRLITICETATCCEAYVILSLP